MVTAANGGQITNFDKWGTICNYHMATWDDCVYMAIITFFLLLGITYKCIANAKGTWYYKVLAGCLCYITICWPLHGYRMANSVQCNADFSNQNKTNVRYAVCRELKTKNSGWDFKFGMCLWKFLCE